MILAHRICIYTPILVEISPAVTDIWGLLDFADSSALRGSTIIFEQSTAWRAFNLGRGTTESSLISRKVGSEAIVRFS